jgi:hypothetical protein
VSELASAAGFTEEVLALCAAMQAAARAGDWVAAANLEAARSSLLNTTITESPELLPAAAWSNLLEQVMACDRAILVQGESEHRELGARILQFRQGARARNAYTGSGPE